MPPLAISPQAASDPADPDARQQLEDAGIQLGEWEPVDKEALLAAIEKGESDSTPSIEVTVYFDDTPIKDRGLIEDPLSEYLEANGIGSWVGSGQGSIGERSFFDVTFTVRDLDTAIPIIQRKLRELGAGPSTKLSMSDDRECGI
jgi:hypothetical protein